ncbi:hypothetical protein B0H13DRAFT_2431003 [Mycena leptocephala]|nr:hypothetical protein B0H13DRAFT_2431003 [Mycena leptocephala]
MSFQFVPPESDGPSQPLSAGGSSYNKLKWSNYTTETASGSGKPALKQRTIASDIPLDKLKVSLEQLAQLKQIYANATTADHQNSVVDLLYALGDDDQLAASAIMAQQGLDIDTREGLDNRCRCGYDHTRYGTKERHTLVPFTSCLGHAEITYAVDSHKILRIRGYFHHNQACKEAEFTRIPPIPVHPSVYIVTLSQLRDGASFADVKKKNRDLVTARGYKDFPVDLHASPYRWLLENWDSRSLYRQFSRMNGVKVTEKPQVNVDEWLDPESPQYNATIAEVVFHYSARAIKGERFEACIATDEMNAAAWKYGHENQIILDGTFGICDSRLLLFIVIVIDKNGKGVPVAFLMFSAPTGNKQSSSGYNTEILTKLIRTWKESLTGCASRHGFPSVVFCPCTCITDTDLKERGALFAVFPSIWLLICRFHLRQSWKNHRNKLLKGKSRLKIDLKHRLKRWEDSLVKTQTIEDARTLLATERELLTELGAGKSILKAIEHINYLDGYWTTDNLWKSWSDFGRKVAASLLGCEMDGVIPTTNHLESFNGVLKRKHLRRWQNGGRRIRVDVLIQILIIHILPSIFQERRLYQKQQLRIDAQIRQLPGGANLLKNRSSGRQILPKIAYLLTDAQRDERARELLAAGQLSAPTFVPETSTCYSSLALEHECEPVKYTISMGLDGVVTCKCLDFERHGGACKHIRGGLFFLQTLRAGGIPLPAIPIPSSITEAHALQTKAVIDRTSREEKTAEGSECPTIRAAAAVADLLRKDEACVESPTKSSQDAVAADRATNNLAALGEQGLARTIYELQDVAPKLGDLAEYMQRKSGPLSISEHHALTQGRGHLAALLAEIDRLIFATPASLSGEEPSQAQAPAPSASQSVASAPSQRHRKRTHLLAPSPEKASKRHQSYGFH